MNISEFGLQHNHTFLWSAFDSANSSNLNETGGSSGTDPIDPRQPFDNQLSLRHGIVPSILLM